MKPGDEKFERELKDFLDRAARETLPKMGSSAMAISIIDTVGSAKLALELGAAILMNKPILVVVLKGLKVSPYLRLIAEEYIEVEAGVNATDDQKIRDAVSRMAKNIEKREPHG